MIDPKLKVEIEGIAKAQAEAVYRNLGTEYGIAIVPRHQHTGLDSPNIPYSSIKPFYEFIHWTVVGTAAATATNYGVFWIAPAGCTVVGFQEVHQTKGTDGSAVTLQLEKLTSTEAPGAGVDLLDTALSLKANINTVQTADMARTYTNSKPDVGMLAGDRLCLKDAGTLTAVANVTVLATIKYN